MEEQILDELLKTRNFYETLENYNLYKYELLGIISDGIFDNAFLKKKITDEKEKEILREIYRAEGIIFNITHEPVMLISDTHFGDPKERLDYFRTVLEFCKQNNIKKLIHGGDVGQGSVATNKTMYTEEEHQQHQKEITNILNIYKDISNLRQCILGGNHDERYLCDNLDLLRLLADQRNILPLGYFQAFFSVFDCPISLEHETKRPTAGPQDLIPHSLTIHGHSHISSFEKKDIYLTALSDVRRSPQNTFKPGFAVMYPEKKNQTVELEFEKYNFTNYGLEKEEKAYIYKLKK